MKCDRCNRVKANVELCGDDMLCRPCEVLNAAELAKLRAAQPAPVKPNLSPPSDNAVPFCQLCNSSVEAKKCLQCDICGHGHHPLCAGISDGIFQLLSQIISTTGWVCQHCKSTSRQIFCQLQAGQSKLAEEVAKLQVSVSKLQSEFQALSNSTRTASVPDYVATSIRQAERRKRSVCSVA